MLVQGLVGPDRRLLQEVYTAMIVAAKKVKKDVADSKSGEDYKANRKKLAAEMKVRLDPVIKSSKYETIDVTLLEKREDDRHAIAVGDITIQRSSAVPDSEKKILFRLVETPNGSLTVQIQNADELGENHEGKGS